MKITRRLVFILFACYGIALSGQNLRKRHSGQDSIVLRCGADSDKMYAVQKIYENYSTAGVGMVLQPAFPSNLIQTCGKFNIYYQDLLNTPAVGFADPTVEGGSTVGQLRMNTFCAVLNYMQSVIQIPTGVTIDLYVDASLNPGSNPAPVTTTFIAHATPYFVSGQLGSSGFFAGNVFDHITSGTDPDAGNYDAYVQVNFDKVYDQTSGASMALSFWDDYQNTTQSCRLDLYTAMLHEMTHALGWFSNVVEDNTSNHSPVCAYTGTTCFSRFDNLFLYYNSAPNAPTGTFTKIVNSSPIGINPAMLALSMPLRTSQIWLYNNGAPLNQPVYSGDQNAYGHPLSSTAVNHSYLSHMNDNFASFTYNAQYSPGYQPGYLMSPSGTWELEKREWTLPELRVLSQFGYSFNYPFNSSFSNSGTVTSSVINNTPAFRNNYNKVTEFIAAGSIPGNSYEGSDFPETATVANFIITTNNNTPGSPTATQLVINLSSDASLKDNEGNAISVIPTSLFNIRGCGSGGNNHTCLTLSNSNQTITYTPRPGFSGRAQFGFYLTDGIERGAFKVYTIDVQNINASYLTTITTIGNNLVMNPGFEEGTEVRLRNISENIENTALDFFREGSYCTGYQASDNHPYEDLNSVQA